MAVYGTAVQQAADLYVEQVNANGGILGKQVQIEWLDTKGDVTEAINAYNRLYSEGVSALLGPVITATALARGRLCRPGRHPDDDRDGDQL